MEVSKKILLVVNPISGDIDKGEFINQVQTAAKERGFEVTVFSTTGKNDRKSIRKLIDSAKINRVLAAGGDGTVTLAATALEGSKAELGIIPMGSANGLSVDLGIPADLEGALKVALGDKVIDFDAVKINGEISLHLSDLGLNALLVKNYSAGNIRGKLGYVKEVLKTLKEHQIFKIKMKGLANGKEEILESEAVMVIFANASKYGTGIKVNPIGNVSDGKFEVIVAHKIDIVELAKLIAGNERYDPEVVALFSLEDAEIEIEGKAVAFQIDGEYKGETNKVVARAVPSYVRLVVPSEASAS